MSDTDKDLILYKNIDFRPGEEIYLFPMRQDWPWGPPSLLFDE